MVSEKLKKMLGNNERYEILKNLTMVELLSLSAEELEELKLLIDITGKIQKIKEHEASFR